MKKFRLNNLIATTVLAIGSLIVSLQAGAAVVCVGTGTVATSCSGVEYKGVTYNVTWELPDYEGTPPSPNPIFTYGPGDVEPQALAVITDINAGLNARNFDTIQYTTPTGVSTDPTCTAADNSPQQCYFVPFAIYPSTSTVGTWRSRFLTSSIPPEWYTNPAYTVDGSGGYSGVSINFYSYANQDLLPVAVFTPVPIPAVLPLFLSGIALLGGVGHRRRGGRRPRVMGA
jgi:hypothetical protein